MVLAEIDTEAPTKNEITHALRELQNRRAGGCDGIPPELYKEGGEALIDMLKSLLDDIWDSEQIPDEWRTSVLLPFHKKGDTQICSNYRGISLLCIGFKLLETILLARLREAYEPAARDNQAGFREKRGCRDQVFALRQILEQRSEFNRSTVMTFIDFKAAFDSVNRNAIWQIFERLGMPQKIANIIRNMYTDTNSIVKMNNNLSNPFPCARVCAKAMFCRLSYLIFWSTGLCIQPLRAPITEYSLKLSLPTLTTLTISVSWKTTALMPRPSSIGSFLPRSKLVSKSTPGRRNVCSPD